MARTKKAALMTVRKPSTVQKKWMGIRRSIKKAMKRKEALNDAEGYKAEVEERTMLDAEHAFRLLCEAKRSNKKVSWRSIPGFASYYNWWQRDGLYDHLYEIVGTFHGRNNLSFPGCKCEYCTRDVEDVEPEDNSSLVDTTGYESDEAEVDPA